MISLDLNRAHVVGGWISTSGTVPFDRGGVVLEGQGIRLNVDTYRAGVAYGHLFDDTAWGTFLHSGQVTAIMGEVRAEEWAALWYVGMTFPYRDQFLAELRDRRAMVHHVEQAGIVVVREPLAVELRDNRAQAAESRALLLGREGNWTAATAHAELAQALGRDPTAAGYAVLALCYTRSGRLERAHALSAVALGSYGRSFLEIMQRSLANLEESFP